MDPTLCLVFFRQPPVNQFFFPSARLLKSLFFCLKSHDCPPRQTPPSDPTPPPLTTLALHPPPPDSHTLSPPKILEIFSPLCPCYPGDLPLKIVFFFHYIPLVSPILVSCKTSSYTPPKRPAAHHPTSHTNDLFLLFFRS